jgi:hypothetical protein
MALHPELQALVDTGGGWQEDEDGSIVLRWGHGEINRLWRDRPDGLVSCEISPSGWSMWHYTGRPATDPYCERRDPQGRVTVQWYDGHPNRLVEESWDREGGRYTQRFDPVSECTFAVRDDGSLGDVIATRTASEVYDDD